VTAASPGRARRPGGLNSTGVRERAKAQGIEVKDRGRVPVEVVVTVKTAARWFREFPGRRAMVPGAPCRRG
jgi:hypothetical protein